MTATRQIDTHESSLRRQLERAVLGGEAHLDAAAVFRDIKPEHWGAHISGAPHTLWQLLEHLRFTLEDLYRFCTDAHYKDPKWPDDYWPETDAPGRIEHAEGAVAALLHAQQQMAALVENTDLDLYSPIAWGSGQTLLREALLAATHTSYHLGQVMFLRKQLEATPSVP